MQDQNIFTNTTQTIPTNNRFEKIVRLRLPIKFKLSSPDLSIKLDFFGRKYQLEKGSLQKIKYLIQEYYFGEVRLADFAKEIEKRMDVNFMTAQEIAMFIRSEIIDWDPWGEYLAKLPHLPLRQIIAKYPKIGETEITAGYIELKSSDELDDPTIRNWLHDYVLHLGQERHSQMERAEYLFHSENGKNLSSPDREKLAIILKSFDENTPLPVDEENEEIVFDSVSSNQRPLNLEEPRPIAGKQDSFIRPHLSQSPPPVENTWRKPAVSKIKSRAPIIFSPPRQTAKPNVLGQIQSQKTAVSAPLKETFHPNLVTIPDRKINSPTDFASHNKVGGRNEAGGEIDKFFNIPEGPDISPIKILGMTEHNERQSVPQPKILRPASPQAAPSPRQKHRIINPFQKPLPEPRIDGNVVDLSEQ